MATHPTLPHEQCAQVKKGITGMSVSIAEVQTPLSIIASSSEYASTDASYFDRPMPPASDTSEQSSATPESSSSSDIAGLTPTMEMLRELWAKVLDRPAESIHPDDEFLALGGDSLSALRLVGQAREVGIRIGIINLMQPQSTLAQMAETIENYHRNAAIVNASDPRPFELWDHYLARDEHDRRSRLQQLAAMCGIAPESIEDVYPCSPMQEGLLATSFQRPGAYSMQNIFILGQDIDVDRFYLALSHLIDRLPILRTRIIATATGSVQLVLRNGCQIAHPTNLSTYLEDDKATVFSHGTPLHRMAIVRQEDPLTGDQGYFVWSAHHAAFDGWSIFRMFAFLVATYKDLPDFVPTPVPRYIRYLTDRQQGYEQGAAYWRSQLAGITLSQFPKLPHSMYRPQARCTLACTVEGDINRKRRYPMATVLRATWAVVVATYTGFAKEATTNVVLSGRDIPVMDIEDMIAPAVTTVPVRTRIDWTQTISQLLESVHQQATDMAAHAHWGLHEIRDAVSDICHDIDPGHLFIVYPSFDDEADMIIQSLGLRLQSAKNFTFDDFALSIECTVDSRTDKADITFRFDEDVLSQPIAEMLLSCYRSLIHQFELQNCTDPITLETSREQSLNELDLLCPIGTEYLRKSCEQTPQSERACVHELIQQAIIRQPSGIAVDAWDGQLSFQELGDAASKVAHQLVRRGVKPETGVGLCLQKSKYAAIAMLAILQSGGAVVPLGIQHPLARIRTVVEDCGLGIAIVDSAQSTRLKGIVPDRLIIDDELVRAGPAYDTAACPDVNPDNVCWIAYTSGSTGTPKGIVLEHAAYSTSIIAQSRRDGFSPRTRTLQFADHTYDAVVEETLATWIAGGCSCIPSEEQRMNDLPAFLRSMKVNFIAATPSVTSLLRPSDIPTLETITLGGEAVRASDVQPWLDAKDIQVMNSYGPSECSVIASQSGPMSSVTVASNIGSPIAGRFWIVDPSNNARLCPIGAPGELYIEGPTLARSYLNDLEKTAKAFITDPPFLKTFPSIEGYSEGKIRVYKTGDLVKHHGDGTFVHLGRCDNQLKIHGQRLEAAEVESRLRQLMPTACHAFVDLVEPTACPGTSLLLAMIEQPLPSEELKDVSMELINPMQTLREALYEILPSYAVPRHVISVSKMPLVASGKLDRRTARQMLIDINLDQLRALDRPLLAEQRASTATEQRLRELWSQILGRQQDDISIHDHFRHLGGDSISAMRLVALARKSQLHLGVADVFNNPRLNEMAKAIDGHQIATDAAAAEDPRPFELCPGIENGSVEQRKPYVDRLAELCNVPSDAVEDAYPCTPLQEGLMAISASQPSTYAAQFVFRTGPRFDLARFKQAIDSVWSILPILRTRIVYTESTSTQVVLHRDLELRTHTDLQSYLAQDREMPFTYGSPLHRFALVNSDDDEAHEVSTYLVWSAHHSAYDGWTLFRILEMLATLYSGRQMSVAGLTPIPRFIHWLQDLQHKQPEITAYWQTQFRDASFCRFPPLPPPSSKPSAQAIVRDRIPCPRKTRTSVATILRATWAMVVATQTGSSDALIAEALSGRDAPVVDLADMVAPALTTVPVRIRIDGGQLVNDYLAMVERQSEEMIPYVHTGVQAMRSSLGAESKADPGHLFVIQPDPGEHLEQLFDTLQLHPVSKEAPDFTGFGLVVSCNVRSHTEEIELEIRFDEQAVSPFLANSIASLFKHLWSQLVAVNQKSATENGLKLGQLSLMCPNDREVLAQANREVHSPVKSCVHELVHTTALRSPQASAINAWDGNMTYGELEQHSLHLAQSLRDAGVGAEVNVGLCMEKSRWAVVSMLAILWAGGTVVPLAVQHPVDAISKVIEAAEMTIALVDVTHEPRLSGLVSCVVVNESVFERQMVQCDGLMAQPARSGPSNPAWIVYTSGSTGQPKGIVLLHENLCTALLAIGNRWTMGESTRSLQFTAHTFDIVMADVFATLLHGGCICIPSEAQRLDDLASFMHSAGVNFAILTPTIANIIHPQKVPDLKHLVLVGEPTPAAVAQAWIASETEVYNAYGPAECSILASAGEAITSPAQAGVIGTRLCGPLWVVDPDDHNRLAAVGAPGELLIEGPLLARGYLNEPEKTSNAFVYDPGFISELGLSPGRRMYCTGDVVQQVDEGGSLAFLERRDTQIKIRGQRMEKCAIESQILQSESAISQACVDLIKLPGSRDAPILVAVIEIGTELESPPAEPMTLAVKIRSNLRRTTPGPMIPSPIVFVARMPVNLSGKLDRLAVRRLLVSMSTEELRASNRVQDGAETLVLSPTAKQLRKAWAVVLQLADTDIGASDHFDQLGGDSVAAMQLVAVSRGMGLHIGVADILQHPQLAELAEIADSYAAASASASHNDPKPMDLWDEYHDNAQEDDQADQLALLAQTCNVDPGTIEDVYPCTPVQEALMAITSLSSNAYLGQMVFRVTPRLDMARFREAWAKLYNLLPPLRTRIAISPKGTSVQVLLRNERPHWSFGSDLENYLAADRAKSIGYGESLFRFGSIESGTGDPEGSTERYFVLTAHHSMYDGWAMMKMVNALVAAYNGHEPEKCAPMTRFIRFIAETDREKERAFWCQQFEAAQPAPFPILPHARYQPRLDKCVEVEIKPSQLRPSVSMPAVLRAAWAIVVASFAGTDDVTLAVALSGRDTPVLDVESIPGPTIAVVPVRIKVGRHLTVAQYIDNVEQQHREMAPYMHTGLHFIPKLVPHLNGGIDPGHLFVIQPAPGQSLGVEQFRELGLSLVPTEAQEFEGYPLVVTCSVGSPTQPVAIQIHHDHQVVSTEQARSMITLLEHLVAQMLPVAPSDNSQSLVGELELLDPLQALRAQTVDVCTPHVQPSHCLHDLVHAVCLEQPDSLAVDAWDGRLSYKELDDRAERLAFYFSQRGVKCGSPVGIYMEKSCNVAIASLGILKAGGIVVPLCIQQPVSRVNTILVNSGTTIILSDSLMAEKLATLDITPKEIIVLDAGMLGSLPWPTQEMPSVVPEDTAFILHTSGSTGVPKGVLLLHKGLSMNFKALGHQAGYNSSIRMLQYSAFSWDVSIAEFYATWQTGGTCCIPSESMRLDVDLLSSFIRKTAVSHAILTPSVAALLEPSQIPSLANLVLGGEAVRESVLQNWRGRTMLFVGFGPVEAACHTHLSPVISDAYQTGCLGIPQVASAWICDPEDHSRLVPLGAPGELLLGGPSLAKGYLNDPERTEAAFVSAPGFCKRLNLAPEHRRMYRTGDIVTQSAKGILTWVGRRDAQVKIRGQRVEIGEIESHASEVDGVSDTAVIFAKKGPLANRLVGFISFQTEHGAESGSTSQVVETDSLDHAATAGIEDHLTACILHYMVPRAWIQLVAIPRNASGKINRLLLTEWTEALGPDALAKYTCAAAALNDIEDQSEATPVERKLQTICSEILLLPISSISRQRSFLSMGGDSVAAIRVVAACRRHGLQLTIRDILATKNISELALRVAEVSDHQDEGLSHVPSEYFDLSPTQKLFQKRMLAAGLEAKNNYRCNQGAAFAVKIPLESEAIEQAIDSLVAKHSMLRARFQSRANDVWSQRIEPEISGSYGFKIHRASNSNKMREIAEHVQDSIDLVDGPVFAVEAVEKDDTWHVVVVAHRLVIDAVSWGILVRDLETVLLRNEMLIHEPVSYPVWIEKLRDRASIPVPSSSEALAIIPSTSWDFWGIQPGECIEADQLATHATIDEATMTLIFGASNDAYCTEPVDIFLAALLHSFIEVFPDRQRPVLHTEYHGRESWSDEFDISDTVGWFAAIVPLYIDEHIIDPAEMLQRISDRRRQLFARGIAHSTSERLIDSEDPIEIFFSHTSRYSHADTSGPFWSAQSPLADAKQVGDRMRTLAALDVRVSSAGKQGKVTIHFNKRAKHQREVQKWTRAFAQTAHSLAEDLAARQPTPQILDHLPLVDVTDVQSAYLTNHIEHSETDMTYTIMESIDATSPLDVDRMRFAYHELLAHFDALRLAFVKKDNKWKLCALPYFKPTIETHIIDSDFDTWTRDFMYRQRFGPLKEQEPPIHIAFIVQKNSHAHRVLVRMSHALVDGISVASFYEALARTFINMPLRKAPRYLDYVTEVLDKGYDAGKAYWTKLLKNSTMTPLAGENRPRGYVSKGQIVGKATFHASLPTGFTSAMLLKSAWAVVLAKHAATTDVVFADTVTGRVNVDPSVATVMGCCIAAIPVRLILQDSWTFHDLMHAVREQQFASMNFETFGMLRILRECTDWDPDTTVTSAFTNALRSAEKHELNLGANRYAVSLPMDQPEQQYTPGSVYINWGQVGDQIDFTMKFAVEHLTEEAARQLFDDMQRVCNLILKTPHCLIKDC